MKISIITAVYNSSATIADCIKSVNDQTYDNIEHIIIDGASKDNTVDIIKSIPNRVTKIVSEPDNGIYDAMNKGIKLATGDVIGILNSDDFYASSTIIEDIVSEFEKNKCDCLFGNLVFVSDRNINKVIRKWKGTEFKPVVNNSIRKKYQLENRFIILGVANVWEKRKGLDDFIHWFSPLLIGLF